MDIILTQQQKDIVDGLMLGDGHMKKSQKGERIFNASLNITRARQDLEYLQYHFDIFKEYALPSGLVLSERLEPKMNKTHPNCYFSTRANPFWSDLRNKWYPNGKKIVPTDLILNPEIIATWICDDGSVAKKKNNYFELCLATNSFKEKEVDFLIDQLEARYKEKFRKKGTPVAEQFTIFASDYAFREVIKDIDPVFPQGMERKRKWAGITEFPDKRESKILSKARRLEQTKTFIINLGENDIFSKIDIAKLLNFQSIKNKRNPNKENKVLYDTVNIPGYLKPYLDNGTIIELGVGEVYHNGFLYRKIKP